MDDLRTRLIEVKLAGSKDDRVYGGYSFRSNENAAEVALGVVKFWLLDQAAQIRQGSGELVIQRIAESIGRTIWPAPWNQDQVKLLFEYQGKAGVHHYTCGNESTHPKLVPSHRGWHCVACDYTQNWAHSHD